MPDTISVATSVQRRCIDLYQLSSFHRPGFSPVSVTYDRLGRREQGKLCISPCTFNPSSVHVLQLHIVCTVICFVVVAGPAVKGSLLTFFIKAYCHDAILLDLSSTGAGDILC